MNTSEAAPAKSGEACAVGATDGRPEAFPIEAALLVGGRSRRMEGADKALLDWGGRPLWRHQAATLEALDPRRRWLLRRPDQATLLALPEGWLAAEDQPGCDHPMPVLLPLLRGLDPGRGLLVLPVDMPRLDAAWLRRHLLAGCRPGRGAVLWHDGRYQPLIACYPAAMAGPVARQVATGDFRWQQVLADAERAGLMRRAIVDDATAAIRLVNVNSPDDWRRLLGTAVTPVRRWRPDGATAGPTDRQTGATAVGDTPPAAEVEPQAGLADGTDDEVVMESPLEIRVNGRSIAVVMRTPGDDEELAAGFLVSEGVVQRRSDLFEVSTCPSHRARRDEAPAGTRGGGDRAGDGERDDVMTGSAADEGGALSMPDDGVVVDVILARGQVDLESLTRHVFAASSCGICGKATIDAVMRAMPPLASVDLPRIDPALLTRMPAAMRRGQTVFERTGGLHGAALFTADGRLLHLREDVGRHNAVDKLLGRLLLDGALPAAGLVLMVSGRVSFEIMQKALAAGVPVVAAVSAPSSLAIEFARRSGQTLVGFLRGRTFNLYAGAARLAAG